MSDLASGYFAYDCVPARKWFCCWVRQTGNKCWPMRFALATKWYLHACAWVLFCWVTVPISSEYKCTCKGWNVERTALICWTRCFSLDTVNVKCATWLFTSVRSRFQRWDISLPSSPPHPIALPKNEFPFQERGSGAAMSAIVKYKMAQTDPTTLGEGP